jgi:hypothetical protein
MPWACMAQRPVADRGLLRLQQADEGADRHQQPRHQFPAVHVQRGGRLQADSGRRRTALQLRGPGPGRPCSSPAATPPSPTRLLFRRVEDARKAKPEMKLVVIDPAAPTRPRPPTCSCPVARHRHGAVQRDAPRDAVRKAGLIVGTCDAPHRGLRRAARRLSASTRRSMAAAICGIRTWPPSRQAAQIFATSPATCPCIARG